MVMSCAKRSRRAQEAESSLERGALSTSRPLAGRAPYANLSTTPFHGLPGGNYEQGQASKLELWPYPEKGSGYVDLHLMGGQSSREFHEITTTDVLLIAWATGTLHWLARWRRRAVASYGARPANRK